MSNRMKPVRSEPGRGGKDEATIKRLQNQVSALVNILLIRETELRDIKGPCSNLACRLHYAHHGPCDAPKK